MIVPGQCVRNLHGCINYARDNPNRRDIGQLFLNWRLEGVGLCVGALGNCGDDITRWVLLLVGPRLGWFTDHSLEVT